MTAAVKWLQQAVGDTQRQVGTGALDAGGSCQGRDVAQETSPREVVWRAVGGAERSEGVALRRTRK